MKKHLSDTISMMTSDSYVERFRAEYHQLKIRENKLSTMLDDWKHGKLNFQPKCSFELLEAQLNTMKVYANLLEARAAIEGVSL